MLSCFDYILSSRSECSQQCCEGENGNIKHISQLCVWRRFFSLSFTSVEFYIAFFEDLQRIQFNNAMSTGLNASHLNTMLYLYLIKDLYNLLVYFSTWGYYSKSILCKLLEESFIFSIFWVFNFHEAKPTGTSLSHGKIS